MTGIEKYNSPAKTQRTGNDRVYGNGNDGNVVIASNTTLSRDMYYNNLTINSSFSLDPNGYKIFVKGTLTLNGNISLGANNTSKTLSGAAGLDPGTINFSIGGNSASNVNLVQKLTDGEKNDILQLIDAAAVRPTTHSFSAIRGGAGGSVGTLTPAGPGGAGTLGGMNAGAPGGPGTVGTTPPAASGGVGGGVVLIVAKTIIGAGSIQAVGQNGGPAATGTAGNAAPDATLTHSVDSQATYIQGDGVFGTTGHLTSGVPLVPHGGHIAATSQNLHGHDTRNVHAGFTHHGNGSHYDHGQNTAGQGPYSHTLNPFTNTEDTSLFTAINNIVHTTAHRPQPSPATVAFTSYGTSTSGAFNPVHGAPHHATHQPATHDPKFGHVPAVTIHYAYPIHHTDTTHTHVAHRRAGTRSTPGTLTKPGGAGGAAGSTTAGISGGGGGIIIITDSIANTVSTVTTGGTAGGLTGESGLTITVINT